MVYLIIEVRPKIFGFFVGFLLEKLVKVRPSLRPQIIGTSDVYPEKVKFKQWKKPRTYFVPLLIENIFENLTLYLSHQNQIFNHYSWIQTKDKVNYAQEETWAVQKYGFRRIMWSAWLHIQVLPSSK